MHILSQWLEQLALCFVKFGIGFKVVKLIEIWHLDMEEGFKV
jgi:hypothetical protein